MLIPVLPYGQMRVYLVCEINDKTVYFEELADHDFICDFT